MKTKHEWNGPLMLFGLLMLCAISLCGTENALMKNSRRMGRTLVESYAAEEERNLQQYATSVQLTLSYIQDLDGQDISRHEQGKRVLAYLKNTVESTVDSDTVCYAVVDGELISSAPFDKNYDYASRPWYQQALQDGGKVVITAQYVSVQPTSTPVITVAAADPTTGNAIAVDLTAKTFALLHASQALPENSSYYLCDSADNLVFYSSPIQKSPEEFSAFAADLCARLRAGTLNGDGDEIQDPERKTRAVFSTQMENGLTCIMTMPKVAMLTGMSALVAWLCVAFFFFMAVALFLWHKDERLRMRTQRITETLRVLGNSYYALYRLDLDKGRYEMIKGSEYSASVLPVTGPYTDLLAEVVKMTDPATKQDIYQTFSPERVQELRRQGTADYGGEFLRHTPDGSRWFSLRLLMDESQGRDEAVLAFNDVNEEKQRTMQHMQLLENALDEADRRRKSQMDFFSSMSHDLRTPLNIILSMTDLALNHQCTHEKRRDYLEKIHAAGQQQLTLINDILEVSRLQNGKIALDSRNFDLCGVVSQCADPFRTECEGAGKRFVLQQQVQIPLVLGDPTRLMQVLNNLLSNAVKFTPTGGTVTLDVQQKNGGSYVFTVADTGCGMSQEFLPHLFEPYIREIRFGARHVSGTGLGMPIVQTLVTRMGGTVTVESELGKGTTFTVTLPFDAGSTEPQQPAAKQAEPDALFGRCVLVAEDNELNLEIAVTLLQQAGAQTVTAANGRLAVEAFQNSEPGSLDAILMDMQMPEMDGCAAAKAIRALDRPDAADIPIVALTANSFAEDIAATTRAGMNAHLTKPIDEALLRTTLAEQIARRENRHNEHTDLEKSLSDI